MNSGEPKIGKHLATFNLFRESYNSLQVTIADASGVRDELGESGAPLRLCAMNALRAALTRTQPPTGDAAREISQQARELLAAEISPHKRGHILGPAPSYAGSVSPRAALRAIESALRSPGGEDPRIAAIREVIERGGYRLVDGRPFTGEFAHGDKCDHDQFGFQDCIACYDEALLAALDPGKGEA